MTQLSSVRSANLMNWNVVIQEVVPVTHDTQYHILFFIFIFFYTNVKDKFTLSAVNKKLSISLPTLI